ncbi:hypothetical protein FRC09_010177, partial [Ceratobasidium sp. 395]
TTTSYAPIIQTVQLAAPSLAPLPMFNSKPSRMLTKYLPANASHFEARQLPQKQRNLLVVERPIVLPTHQEDHILVAGTNGEGLSILMVGAIESDTIEEI